MRRNCQQKIVFFFFDGVDRLFCCHSKFIRKDEPCKSFVGFLTQAISPSQTRNLRGQKTQETQTNIHASSGTGIHDLSVRALNCEANLISYWKQKRAFISECSEVQRQERTRLRYRAGCSAYRAVQGRR
jgi:hypothetical protein